MSKTIKFQIKLKSIVSKSFQFLASIHSKVSFKSLIKPCSHPTNWKPTSPARRSIESSLITIQVLNRFPHIKLHNFINRKKNTLVIHLFFIPIPHCSLHIRSKLLMHIDREKSKPDTWANTSGKIVCVCEDPKNANVEKTKPFEAEDGSGSSSFDRTFAPELPDESRTEKKGRIVIQWAAKK